VVPPGQIGAVEQVETIDIEPSTLQSATLGVQDVSVSPTDIPHVPVTGEEANNTPPYTFGPSWTFLSGTQAPNPTAPKDEVDEEVDSDDENPYIGSEDTTSTNDVHGDPSHLLDPVALQAENTATSEYETGDVGSGDGNPNAESQLSEKARGKKRMREEDYSSDEKDESEALEELLGGSSTGGCNPSSSSRTSSDCDGQPDRKRVKTDTDTDTRISTDPLEVDDMILMVARRGLFDTLTDAESCRQVKKLKEIEKLYRSGRLPL